MGRVKHYDNVNFFKNMFLKIFYEKLFFLKKEKYVFGKTQNDRRKMIAGCERNFPTKMIGKMVTMLLITHSSGHICERKCLVSLVTVLRKRNLWLNELYLCNTLHVLAVADPCALLCTTVKDAISTLCHREFADSLPNAVNIVASDLIPNDSRSTSYFRYLQQLYKCSVVV